MNIELQQALITYWKALPSDASKAITTLCTSVCSCITSLFQSIVVDNSENTPRTENAKLEDLLKKIGHGMHNPLSCSALIAALQAAVTTSKVSQAIWKDQRQRSPFPSPTTVTGALNDYFTQIIWSTANSPALTSRLAQSVVTIIKHVFMKLGVSCSYYALHNYQITKDESLDSIVRYSNTYIPSSNTLLIDTSARIVSENPNRSPLQLSRQILQWNPGTSAIPSLYELKAVVIYEGTKNIEGFYITYVLDHGRWIEYFDDIVRDHSNNKTIEAHIACHSHLIIYEKNDKTLSGADLFFEFDDKK